VIGAGVLSAQAGTKKIYDVSDEITAPRLLEAATPGYTDEAKKKKIEGEVIVSVVVDENGDVTQPKIKTGLGYGLDESAIEAAKVFKYKPATKDDVPVAVRQDLSFSFYLPSK
jgi:TonB family protein